LSFPSDAVQELHGLNNMAKTPFGCLKSLKKGLCEYVSGAARYHFVFKGYKFCPNKKPILDNSALGFVL